MAAASIRGASDDPWTHHLRLSDLALAAERIGQHTSGEGTRHGLPWSADGVWPLAEQQIRLLCFEMLLLSRPPPAARPNTPANSPAVTPTSSTASAEPALLPARLRATSAVQRRELAETLSARLVKGLSALEAEHEESVLPAVLRPPPRRASPRASDRRDDALSRGMDEAAGGTPGRGQRGRGERGRGRGWWERNARAQRAWRRGARHGRRRGRRSEGRGRGRRGSRRGDNGGGDDGGGRGGARGAACVVRC